ncbi:AvrD family protein [Streptomyces sp. B8F3]|uniref:AvrD family protein n=1 Tax=Streptomyces sp. B8F3 TaxID=3153573 RepID=UPI00325D0150
MHGAARRGRGYAEAEAPAGSEPVEDGLGHFSVGATEDAVIVGSAPGVRRTTADCRVGAMAVRAEVEHPAGDRTGAAEGAYATAERRPGPWNDAPFGASHFGRSQFVTGVAAEGDEEMSADLAVTAGTRAGGAGLRPTMIDLFVAALQLGQVLLYRYDGIERAASHTLWMRTTSISLADTPDSAGGTAYDDGRLRVALRRPVKLTTERGTWRVGRLTSTSAGMRLACNVAHLLP